MRFLRTRCERRGHDWFGYHPSQFIVNEAVCLRCAAVEVTLPSGTCLGGHPLAEHYAADGKPIPHPTCGGPR